MVFSDKRILENKYFSVERLDSVLAIPNILSFTWQTKVITDIGKLWTKKAKNGRNYLKVQIRWYQTPTGKPLYAKAWPRESEPDIFDVYADSEDLRDVGFTFPKEGSTSHWIGAVMKLASA